MPTLSIRPASPTDLPLIITLIRDLATYEREPDAVVATGELVAANLFGPAQRPPVARCLIGEIDGAPQGFAIYFYNFSTWLGRPGIYLEDLFVRPAARGHGLGKALFTHIAALAHAQGCGRMEWAVLDWNTPAIEFYKHLGAVPMSEWTTYRLAGTSLAAVAAMAESAPALTAVTTTRGPTSPG